LYKLIYSIPEITLSKNSLSEDQTGVNAQYQQAFQSKKKIAENYANDYYLALAVSGPV
jgi:hypothetical protein